MAVSRRWAALVAAVLLCVCGAVSAQSSSAADDADDDCLPAIADTCFADVTQDVHCLLRARNLSTPTLATAADCVERDAADLCRSLQDALNCSSDIIDSDCSAADGRPLFDGWLRGLRAAAERLCAGRPSRLQRLLASGHRCTYRQLDFMSCMEGTAGVTHVADLLKYRLDDAGCRQVLRAALRCARTPLHCALVASSTADILSDLVTAFLLESPCAGTAWLAAAGADAAAADAPVCATEATSAGVTALLVVLVCMTLTLAGVLVLVAHRTSCFRIPLPRRG